MSNRPRHRVSVKVAIMNSDRDKVLMTVLEDGRYGLPGGHVEGAESPDNTVVRELKEELGLDRGDYGEMRRYDFWRDRQTDRIILGYVGRLREEATIEVDGVEVADTVWVSRADLESGRASSASYDTFILSLL